MIFTVNALDAIGAVISFAIVIGFYLYLFIITR